MRKLSFAVMCLDFLAIPVVLAAIAMAVNKSSSVIGLGTAAVYLTAGVINLAAVLSFRGRGREAGGLPC